MKIYTQTVWNWADKTPVFVSEESIDYDGPVDLAKGPTNEEKALQKSQADFYNQLRQTQADQLSKQTALFNNIRSVYDPIIAAGPSQYGFGAAQDRALRTQATEGTAAEYRAASAATASAMAARGGGNTFLPSGAEADITGRVAGAAAGKESQEQLGITQAGYEAGRQQFDKATGVEMGIATGGYNPLGWAGSATSAGKEAFDMASEIQKEQAAASPWGTIGGILGGAASSFLGNPSLFAPKPGGSSGGGSSSDGGWGVF